MLPPIAMETPSSAANHDPAESPPRSRTIRWIFTSLLVAATVVLCSMLAYYSMYSIFMDHDDEGTLLLVLSQLAKGKILYDQVLTQYGPIAFLPKLALVKLFSIPVTHDTGRAITLACWLIASFMAGGIAWRLTNSILWFATAPSSAVSPSIPSSTNPATPRTSAVSSWPPPFDRRPLARPNENMGCVVVRRIGALFLMTKINLGAFYLAALGSTLISLLPPGKVRRSLLLCTALLGALPFFLMHNDFTHAATIYYAAQIAVAFLASLTIADLSNFQDAPIRPRQIFFCAVSFLITLALIILITLSLGTTFHELIRGVIGMPLLVSQIFTIPPLTSLFSVTVAAVGCVIGITLKRSYSPKLVPALGVIRVLAALIALNCIIDANYTFVFNTVPAVAWLLLLPVRRPDSPPTIRPAASSSSSSQFSKP